MGVYKRVHVRMRTCRWKSEVDIRGPSERELTDFHRSAGQLGSGSCQGYLPGNSTGAGTSSHFTH